MQNIRYGISNLLNYICKALILKKTNSESIYMKTQASEITKAELKGLIAAGQEKEALGKIMELAEIQSKEIQQYIFILSNRYKKLQKELLIGNVSSENAAVRSADINFDLLNLIDKITFITKKENPVQLKQIRNDVFEPKSKTTSFYKFISFAVLTLIILSSLFYFRNQLFSSQAIDYQEFWKGQWQHSREAGENIILSGVTNFYQEGKEWKGRSNSKLNTGDYLNDSLFNFRFSEDGKIIKGNWININNDLVTSTELKGTFTFELNTEDKKSFKGKYSLREQNPTKNEKDFVWNGIKKE